MLREKNSIKDVVINWIILLFAIIPAGSLLMLGYIWCALKLLGHI